MDKSTGLLAAVVTAIAVQTACGGDGATGPAGAQGAAGTPGAAGTAGAPGAAGATGPTGPTGPTGSFDAGTLAVPTNGLVAYYRGAGTDLSTGGKNATVSDVTLAADRFGTANTAGSYNGMSSFLSVASHAAPSGTAARAVSAWFKTRGSGTFGSVFSYGAPTTGQRFSFLVSPYGGSFFAGQNADVADDTVTVNDNEWHHVVVNYDGTTVAVYVDRDLALAGTPTLATAAADVFLIGASKNPAVGAEPFNGLIDSVRVYNRVLTKEDRTALYQEGGWR